MSRLLARTEVPQEETWNLDDIYPSQEAFEAELSEFPGAAQAVTAFRGRLGEGAGVLLDCLRTWFRILERVSRLNVYAFLRVSVDGLSADYRDAHSRASSVMASTNANSAYIGSELMALPPGTIRRYLEEEPALGPWRRWLEWIESERSHRLDTGTETVIAALSEVLNMPDMVYRQWRVSDLSFPIVRDGAGRDHQLTVASYERVCERSSDATLRRDAYKAFIDSLARYKNTVAALWGTQVRKNVLLARLRGYTSAVEMSLSKQETPREVFDQLHEVILTGLAPAMRRLALLRKRVLGLSEVLYCDIEADLDPGYRPISTYDEARDAITGGLAVLGEEYTGIIEAAFRERWIDWAVNRGKTSDCFGGGGEPHPYVLIGWDGTMRSAMVLAHELGHAAHSFLSTKYQTGYNRAVPLLLCEAASTTSEAIVGDCLMERSKDPRTRRWVIMHLLTSYYHNFVRHLIESELQRRLYAVAEADRPVTAEVLCETQGDILKEFWGDAVTIDEGAKLTWMRQIHYYSPELYSWTYAGGLTIGIAVVRAIRREGALAAERWLRVLKAGGSMPPMELAKIGGADLMDGDVVRDAVSYVTALIDELIRSF